jgi:septal ring factor EnvC (AmiA/AmiB activator)
LSTAIVAVATTGLFAQQADRARTEALAERAAERLQSLQREADQLAADERTLLNDLRKLEVQRQIKAEELARLTADTDAAAAEIDSTTTQIEALEAREQAERPDLRARLVEIYKFGRARYFRLLFSTSEIRQIGRASRLVAALAEVDRRRLDGHRQTRESLINARHDLDTESRRLRALRGDAESAERAAAAAARARGELIRDIDRRRDLNAQLTSELIAAQQKLQATLRDVANAAAGASPALPILPFRGALDWPVAGALRARFGAVTGGRAPASNGIEIASPEGTPVQAVHEGLVAYAEPFAGFGNLVIVDHGSQVFSLYGDLLEVLVKRGTRLEGGQPVGRVGTAAAGTAGLYFELRVDGRPVDPLQWLKKRQP